MLYACGVQEVQPLARRLVAIFRLAAEQLSTQQHYDFGLRSMRAVLLTAATLLQQAPATGPKEPAEV